VERASKPIAALLEQRRAERAKREHAFTHALEQPATSQASVARAEQQLAEHTAQRPQAKPTEPGARSSGLALARESAFQTRHLTRTAQLRQALELAQAQHRERADRVQKARRALSQASADEKAIEQHQHASLRAEQRRLFRREQELQDEQVAAQIFARKGPHL